MSQNVENGFPLRSRIVQTLNVEERFLGGRKHWRGISVRQDPFVRANGLTKCGGYLLGLHSLRPCRKTVLNILKDNLGVDLTSS
jgi:hypothetical protein